MVEDIWARPPTFLLVDYYDMSSVPDSVFKIAADMNGLPYPPAGLGRSQFPISA
jgi:hypothetical protein